MKTLNLIALGIFLVCLFQIGLFQGHQTLPPVAWWPLSSNPMNSKSFDPFMALATVSADFGKIVRDYELAIAEHKLTMLTRLESRIEDRVYNATAFLVDIDNELRKIDKSVFMDQIMLEDFRVTIQVLLRAYKQIVLQIVGIEKGVAVHFPRYVYSDEMESLNITTLAHKLDSLRRVDLLLLEAYQHNHNSTNYPKAVKQTFRQYFAKIEKDITSAHDSIADVYYPEVERLQLNGEVLAILQQVNAEQSIDILNELRLFIQKYEKRYFALD